ncbi:MAG: hypothetical protein ACD_58C00103G0001 [uncultured bacterium]|nr:MAG: hypothetical protein ACD_58C00103G0001 [uncultured bacterium]
MAFWVDETINEILKRKDKKYLITDYKTPSGKIHVGALRGVIIHDVIYKGLLESGKKSEFIYGFDDMDPMDDVPSELAKEFSKYMGQPLCNIPSPDCKASSYAQFFAKEFKSVYKKLGVKSKTVWASQLYKSGKYDKAIKIILDSADKIRQIYFDVSGGKKPDNWYPLSVICPKCGKIGTTRVFDWDGKEVSFVCEPNLVKWAQGCGYQGKISPFSGNAKLPYKVETPSKWYSFGTSVELAGKDHYTKGGSFDIARRIAQEVFKIRPVYGYGYEWFLVGGKKMSTSKGVGSFATEIADILPSELLRFLMVRTRAKRTIDFDPYGTTILDLYDEYDRCIDAFLDDPKSDQARAYYFTKLFAHSTNAQGVLSSTPPIRIILRASRVYGGTRSLRLEESTSKDEVSASLVASQGGRPPQYRMRFVKVAYLLQMARVNIDEYASEEKQGELTVEEENDLKIRREYARRWLDFYAPDNYKFKIQKELPEVAKSLSSKQIEFLHKIADLLEYEDTTDKEEYQKIAELIDHKILKGEKLHSGIHNLKKEMNLDAKLAFSAIYLSLIGKDSGPQAGWLIASLDKDFVIKRFRSLP